MGHPWNSSALSLMHEYTQSLSLRRHMLAVEAAMRAYARKFGQDEDKWGLVGLIGWYGVSNCFKDSGCRKIVAEIDIHFAGDHRRDARAGTRLPAAFRTESTTSAVDLQNGQFFVTLNLPSRS